MFGKAEMRLKRQLFGQAGEDFKMRMTPAWCGWIGIIAIYQCDYVNTRKCGNITALGNLQTKRGPLKFPQVFFFDHFWRLRSFFNRPYSWILQIMPALPSPRKSHILNPPMAFSVIIIKSSMYSYTTLYTIY